MTDIVDSYGTTGNIVDKAIITRSYITHQHERIVSRSHNGARGCIILTMAVGGTNKVVRTRNGGESQPITTDLRGFCCIAVPETIRLPKRREGDYVADKLLITIIGLTSLVGCIAQGVIS